MASKTKSREVEREAKLPAGELDKKCTDDDILKIYLSVPYTIQLASLLKLSLPQRTALENFHGSDEDKQLKLLQKWKQVFAFKAKRRVLVDALIAMDHTETAVAVCKLLRPPGRCYTPPEEDEPMHTDSEAEYQQNSPRTEILPTQEVANQQRGQPSSMQQGSQPNSMQPGGQSNTMEIDDEEGGRDELVVGGHHPGGLRVEEDDDDEDKTTSQAEGGGADNIERDGVGDALKNIFSKSSKKKDHGMEHPSGSKGPPAPYEMKAKPRGIAIVINNETFDEVSELSLREGTDFDAKKLVKLFGFLGFKAERYDNQTAEEMRNIMKTTAAKYNEHKNYDCLMVSILTHGGDGGILWGSDGADIQLQSLTRYFDGKNCKALIGKPKVFIMQACRGTKRDRVRQSSDCHDQHDSTVESDAEEVARFEADYKRQLPAQGDFLLGFSTCPGYLSWRAPDSGTFYINAFDEKVREYAPGNVLHLVDILTEVNNKLTTDDELAVPNSHDKAIKYKQVPSTVTRLSKQLFFNLDNLT